MIWAARHPIAVVSLFTVLALAGGLSIPMLPVELLPSLSYPRLIIRTTFGSAAPEEVETLITRPVESAVGTVAGLRGITSLSTEGVSTVTLRFDWGARMSLAAAEVREKLDGITEALPRDIKPPFVLHYDPSDEPVLVVAFHASGNAADLRVRAETLIKPELEALPGVATVRVSGGNVQEIQVLVDKGRLVAHNIDLKMICSQIENANINFPGGKIVQGPVELPLRTVGRFASLTQIAELPVAYGTFGGPIRIGDIAEVKEAPSDRTSISRFNGKPAVLLSVIKEPSANAVNLSKLIRGKVQAIRRSSAQASELDVVQDQGPFVEEALHDLRDNLILGSILAAVVLMVGLRNVLHAGLIVISIPISVVATLAFMAAGGVTLNFMSIGGLAIGVGMLVDASIVVMESIHRHSLRTADILEAVQTGISEVSSSVISGAMTSIVVLIPIFFMTGLAQRLFRDFAFTMGCSHLLSLITALFLLPALVVLTHAVQRKKVKPGPSRIQLMYQRRLPLVLKHKGKIIGVSALILAVSVVSLERLGFELLPNLETDQFTVRLVLPPDSSIEAVEKAVRAVEAKLKHNRDVVAFITEAGTDSKNESTVIQKIEKCNEAKIGVKLRAGGGSELRENVITYLRTQINQIPGITLEFELNRSMLSKALGGSENTQLLQIIGEDLWKLTELANLLSDRLKGAKCVTDVACDGNVWTNQIQVIVDRYRSAARGLSVQGAAEAVQTAVEGKIVGKLIRGDKESDIRVRLRQEDRVNFDDLKQLPLRSGRGLDNWQAVRRQEPDDHERSDMQKTEELDETVPLGLIAEFIAGQGPREILRSERHRVINVHGNVVGAFSKAQEEALEKTVSLKVPQGYEIQPSPERFEIVGSLRSLMLALFIALMLTYAVMAIQFESIRWPFVILLTIPLTVVGPALMLNLYQIPINVLVLIGAVVLVGIVVNNGILMVAYINQLRSQKLPMKAAIIQGCKVRLQPVLMSTATNVLGVLPVCFGWGSGAALRKALALTVASGLIASLVFTLFLVPVIYELAAGRNPDTASDPK
jgi:hydrophobic/amphiphilic exporter-1 (mainly G- bacteria), HAE1 family